MTDIAIRVENLSKRYRIGQYVGSGAHGAQYKTLRESLTDAVSAPLRRLRQTGDRRRKTEDRRARSPVSGPRSSNPGPPSPVPGPPSTDGYIWALKDVSFEVKRGEVIGIIGPNGAGKSTLLKILTGITEPTEGRAELSGRVNSLLEVGTGFHPELTGRENVRLSGAILGMTRKEIDRKFDEIVDFSGVETYIDTPVKRYSSGMRVRLGFAVAAHLEPEILLIDEVLAVGDAAFQKKCLGKMGNVAREGRTVLFVSHNLGSLANLCPRALLLVQGKKWRQGPSDEVISEYITMGRESQGERVWHDLRTAPGNEKIRLRAIRIVSDGEVTADVDIQKDVQVEIEFWNLRSGAMVHTSVGLYDRIGVVVLASANMHSANLIKDEWFGKPHPAGLYRTRCTIPGNFLNEGAYSISASILIDLLNVEAVAREVVSFTVHETGDMRKEYGGVWQGVVRPKLAWQTAYLQALNGTLLEGQAR